MLLAVLYVCSLAACSSQLGGGSFLGCFMDEEQVQKAQCLAQGPTARRCQWGALNPCPASQVPCGGERVWGVRAGRRQPRGPQGKAVRGGVVSGQTRGGPGEARGPWM